MWLRIEATLAMNFQFNLQLVLATAGTLLSLFLMILIVGYRRRRVFEQVLFFLALAFFFLLLGNTFISKCFAVLPFWNSKYHAENCRFVGAIRNRSPKPLLIHTHFAYGRDQMGMPRRWWQTTITIFAYVPVVVCAIAHPTKRTLRSHYGFSADAVRCLCNAELVVVRCCVRYLHCITDRFRPAIQHSQSASFPRFSRRLFWRNRLSGCSSIHCPELAVGRTIHFNLSGDGWSRQLDADRYYFRLGLAASCDRVLHRALSGARDWIAEEI